MTVHTVLTVLAVQTEHTVLASIMTVQTIHAVTYCKDLTGGESMVTLQEAVK
jgi:hypothetical protein